MTTMPKFNLGVLRRRHYDDTPGYPTYLSRVQKRLKQVQAELDVWITNPTKEGILTTHMLEDEKQLILKIIDMVSED